ncbi:MAG: beta-lactamase family protein, partial [Balneolales bacterium]|nr:beta-lactamase family protein [Balneolales bacterium]
MTSSRRSNPTQNPSSFILQKMWLLFGLAVFIGGMAPQPTAAQTERPPVPEDLAAWIETGMAAWDIPGMSVSIVRDDEVIFAQGFGIRKLGETEAVDEHTIFGVASTTKAFTAAALGLLVDEGRLGWDDPVTRHLPGFELYDPYVTRAITIR